MATVEVKTDGNKKAGSLELAPAVFEVPVKGHLFHAEVRRQLAQRQRGTHSSRNRAAVSGGGAKPWRQKGTGRARQGTTRAPQWAGGGSVFGPVPRGHGHSLPKKMRRAALCGALSLRLGEDALSVVDTLELAEPKTRALIAALAGIGLDGSKTVLIAVDAPDASLDRASRNLPWAQVIPVAGLNTYDVLRHERLVLTRGAVDAVHARFGKAKEGGA